MTIKITITRKEIGYYHIVQRIDGMPRIQVSVDRLEHSKGGNIYGYVSTGQLVIILTPTDYDMIEYNL